MLGAKSLNLRRMAAAAVLLTAGCAAQGPSASPLAGPPDEYLQAGKRAMEATRTVVALGPRPAGSAAQQKQQQVILERLRELRCEIEEHDFTVSTPIGRRPMKNIIARFDGRSDRAVVVSGHYDTKLLTDFVGANDGGSSTGLLLALAEMLEGRELADDVWILFLDGEESFVQWTDEDHTYGSRRQAQAWVGDGQSRRVKALINVDMIGDADLRLIYESASTVWLRDLVWDVASRLGYERAFPRSEPAYIADDHVEFLERGFAALDLIDLDYGPGNRYWHTPEDTMDKLDARSFAVVLHVLVESLAELEKKP